MEKMQARNRVISSLNEVENKDDSLMRLANILQAGHKRSCEAIGFFEEKADMSRSILHKAFFEYLCVKKAAQRTVLEKIALSLGLGCAPVAGLPRYENACENTQNSDESLADIFSIIHEIAADELEFYFAYAAVEKNVRAHSLLLMMADLAKEFLFDVKIWYLNHKDARKETGAMLPQFVSPGYSAEAVLN